MSKARVVVSKVISKQLSVSEAAAKYGVSRQHVHRWLARYRDQGIDGLEPRSRRPHSNPQRTASEVVERIVALRQELAGQGLDHGPETIGWHLGQEHLRVPSTSTIRRILVAAGLVTAEPKKRPKSSYRRFEADQPNECWQSDFTHWRLTDGTGAEIINWLDDHSRYLLAAVARRRITGEDVVTTFLAAVDSYGLPRSTLTDNGSVYTSRFTGGRNGFEYLLASLGIAQKNGHPNHPQTQGKIERFHQTLKRWLAAQPAAATLADLQAQLDRFSRIYNDLRPHRALNRATPATAYAATPKARPATASTEDSGHYRLRYDRTDSHGKISFRRAGRMHHLGVGAANAHRRVLAIADQSSVSVIDLSTGEVLSTHTIDPDRSYWRNQQKRPGRWPGRNQ
jgi:transposase InsO family protein